MSSDFIYSARVPRWDTRVTPGNFGYNDSHLAVTAKELFTTGVAHSAVSTHRSVDATGRALPMTVEEIQARAVEIARGLDALDDMGDEEEQRQTLSALMKAIDEEPILSLDQIKS